MKKVLIIVFALLILIGVVTKIMAQNIDIKTKQSGKQLMLKLTVKTIIADLQQKQVLDIQQLADFIKSQKESHQDRLASEKLCQDYLQNTLLEQYQTAVKQVKEKLDQDVPEGLNSWFDETVVRDLMNYPSNIVEDVNSQMQKVFVPARDLVCKSQQDDLITQGEIYPTSAEIEAVAMGDKSYEDLVREMKTRFYNSYQSLVIFSENNSWIQNEQIEPIITSGLEQFREEQKIIIETPLGIEYIPTDVMNRINGQVLDFRVLFAKNKPYCYANGFPSSATQVLVKSNQLALEKFTNALSDPDRINCTISEDVLQKVMSDNLKDHADIQASKSLCQTGFTEPVWEEACRQYQESAPQTQRELLGAFISKEQVREGANRKLYSLVDRSISVRFSLARDNITQSQMKLYFTPLADRVWQPKATVIEYWQGRSLNITDPFAQEGIASATSCDQNELLQETKIQVRESVESAISEGVNALASQMDLVQAVESSVVEWLEQVDATYDDTYKQFCNVILKSWQNSEYLEKYPIIFNKTAEEVKRRVKALMSAWQKKKQDIEKQRREAEELSKRAPTPQQKDVTVSASGKTDGDDKKGGDGSKGMGTGIGGDVYEQTDVVDFEFDALLDFDYDPTTGVVLFTSKMVFEKEVPKSGIMSYLRKSDVTRRLKKTEYRFKPDDVKKVHASAQLWKEEVTEWLKQSEKEEIFIIARIHDNDVLYYNVYEFRSIIDEAHRAADNNKINILGWLDGMVFDPLFSKILEKGLEEVKKYSAPVISL